MAQLKREDRDCVLKRLKCSKCEKEFPREKDMRYHSHLCGSSVGNRSVTHRC